jgi:DNA-directed RNA polymerase subunit RPC12/RpoP
VPGIVKPVSRPCYVMGWPYPPLHFQRLDKGLPIQARIDSNVSVDALFKASKKTVSFLVRTCFIGQLGLANRKPYLFESEASRLCLEGSAPHPHLQVQRGIACKHCNLKRVSPTCLYDHVDSDLSLQSWRRHSAARLWRLLQNTGATR